MAETQSKKAEDQTKAQEQAKPERTKKKTEESAPDEQRKAKEGKEPKEAEQKSQQREAMTARDVVGVVEELLREAVQVGASDIHFEPQAKELQIKYRLDGVLTEVERLPRSLAENVISRLKVLGGLLTYRNDIPQEGRIVQEDSRTGSLQEKRLAVFPTIHGQRAVVRIFHEDPSLQQVGQLGLPQQAEAVLEQIARQNQGVLLLTGPAGSGKSTTLAAMLRFILERFPGRSVVTLEDPVERQIEGATQIQIPPHGEMTFALALRSLLRQDPEVLMLGEIRDAQTARIAIEAGLTGHLLLSTMHGGTPAGALLRLLEMGLEPYQITSSVCAVLNQRLLRRLCPSCKSQSEEGRPRARGCEACLQTGYAGRLLVAELVQLDGELRRALLAGADLETLQQILLRQGHKNLVEHGRERVRQGETSEEELWRVCGGLEESPL